MYVWQHEGEHQKIPAGVDRVPEFDPRTGEHLWTVNTMYRWSGPDTAPMLDHENLLLIVGPGCFYCEKNYTPQLYRRRCKGKP